ncbi:MAG: hypothetical protein ACI965_002469, partial [Paraglaciecola sp.]
TSSSKSGNHLLQILSLCFIRQLEVAQQSQEQAITTTFYYSQNALAKWLT